MGFDHAVMQAVQTLWQLGGSVMDLLFASFTFLGEETFLLVVVFGIYWCVNKKTGEYLLLSLYTSIGVNGVLKDLIRRPRPFLTPGFEDLRYVQIKNPLVDTVHLKESFSFPSGHSMCAGAFFGGLAFRSRRAKTALWCGLAILAVMTSRIYLGVHFPTDVLVGAAAGLIIAAVCSWLFTHYYEKRLWMFTGAVALTAAGLLLSPTPDTIKTIGVGVGALIGLFWDKRFNFSTEGTTGRRILRLVIGALSMIVLRGVLKAVFPAGVLFDGLRYGVLGLIGTGLWPWIFTRCKL